MKKLWKEDIVNPSIEYAENHTENGEQWINSSGDMFLWDSSHKIMDWSRRRDIISPLFYAKASANLSTYGSLTSAEKLLGAKYFLVPYSLRVTNGIVTEEEDYINGEILLKECKKSRKDCVESMRSCVWNDYVRKGLMTLAQSQQMFDDTDEGNKILRFENANNSDFKNWIFGLAPFENIFNQKNYFSVDLQNKLIDIYNGDY